MPSPATAYGDEVAGGAIWLLAAYPFAIFFGALYTESLFLLGTAGAFYHFSKQQFGRAACWGLLVGLTRVNGALMVLPLAVLALSSTAAPLEDQGARRRRRARRLAWPSTRRSSGRLTGHPLAFAASHAAWGRTYQGLGTLVTHQYSILANAGLSGYVGTPGYDVLNAIGAIFAIATIWPVTRRLGAGVRVVHGAQHLPGARRRRSAFGRTPFFRAVSRRSSGSPRRCRRRQRPAWIATFAALQAFGAALFYTWRPLF